MQNIGLLMTYNEADIIEEVMNANKKYFDKILVLDGSNDGTDEILKSFDNVVYLIRDQDLFPQRKVRDGARQFLLEEAQKRFGHEGWFTILHGDEIFVDDPNQIAKRAEKAGAEKVNWHSLSFFLHTSQKEEIFDPQKPLEERVIYYQPGSLEIRQFKNKSGIFYDINQHNKVFPLGLNNKILFDFPIFKHYIERSPSQGEFRPHTGFVIEESHKFNNKFDYKDRLFENLKQVRKYEGNFGEFTPGQRPNFFMQWLKWHRYIK